MVQNTPPPGIIGKSPQIRKIMTGHFLRTAAHLEARATKQEATKVDSTADRLAYFTIEKYRAQPAAPTMPQERYWLLGTPKSTAKPMVPMNAARVWQSRLAVPGLQKLPCNSM